MLSLRTEAQRIREIIRNEEERFSETLEKGLVILEDAAAKLKQQNRKRCQATLHFGCTTLTVFRWT